MNRLQRRGAMLVLVVIVTALVGGLLTLLAANIAHFHARRQADRVREISQAISDSAIQFARARRSVWSQASPEEPVELDVKALLPMGMSGSATLNFLSMNDRKICRISAQAESGPYLITREADVPLNIP